MLITLRPHPHEFWYFFSYETTHLSTRISFDGFFIKGLIDQWGDSFDSKRLIFSPVLAVDG